MKVYMTDLPVPARLAVQLFGVSVSVLVLVMVAVAGC